MFFNTLINGLVHSNNLDNAVKLSDKIVKLGLEPNIFTYGTMFKGLCRIRNHIGALSLLPKMESKSGKFFHLLPFSSSSLLHLPPNFSFLLSTFPFFQLPFSFSSRNYASHNVDDHQLFLESLREQCKLGFTNTDHAFSLFNDVIFLRPLPNIIDFNQLLSAMCKIKPFPPFSIVISLYRQLLLLGIRPDNFSLTIMANCYCRLVDLGFSILASFIKLGY
ncbi:hypothetical protein RDABS01_019454 [Bienertia sinuspersici]